MKSWHFFAVLCLGVLCCGTVGVQAGNGTGENIGSTAWNMEDDTQYEYASNCGVVWTPASTTPSEIAFIPTVTLGSVEDALFTRGAALAMDWDPEGTPLSASYNTKRVGVTGIQSTSWESVVNGAVLDNNPEACGGGKRIYPETDLSGTLKNTVNVRVTLENAIPEGMTGSLRLMVLDPMNQCKDGNNQSVGSFSSWQHDSWQCDNMDPEVVSLCEVQRDYISTNSFWAIQVIRAWEIDSYYGYSINNNQVFVAATKCYSTYNEDELTESQLRDIYRYVLLHELLHSFNISHDNSGIMSSAFAINNVLSISGRRLTNEHIRSIQQMVEPN